MKVAASVMILGVLLLSCSCTHDSEDGRPPSTDHYLHSNFIGKTLGEIAVAGDEGSPFIVEHSANTLGPPSVGSAGLSGNLPDSGSASYLQQSPGSRITRIGASFSFRDGVPGGGNGAICLATWVKPVRVPIERVPDSPMHLVISPTEAGLTYWLDGSPSRPIFVHRFNPPLRSDGSTLSSEVEIHGDHGSALLPDGTVEQFSYGQLTAISAGVANWEFFKHQKGDANVQISSLWADL